MTDKQMIIDGVDVSGCAYITYRDSDNPICSETGMYCGGYDICYYKQLKHKEQESERLEEELDDLTREIGTSLKVEKIEIKKLKKECKELKRELMQYEKDVKDLNYFAMKLKQTLAEIKGLVNKLIDNKGYAETEEDLILQKISEVEDAN